MKNRILALLVGTCLATPAMSQDLTIWALQAFNTEADAYLGQLAEEFGKEAGIDAEYVVVPANVLDQRLAAAFEAGTPPDVFMQVSQQAQYYMARDLVIPLGDVLDDVQQANGDFYESVLPAATYKGEIHALPLEVDVVPMYVRTDLLADVGAEIPQTWGELREAAQKIKEANPMIQPVGISLSNSNDAEAGLRTIMWAWGGAMFSEDGEVTFDSPETRAAFQFIADMFKEGTIPRSVLTWDDGSNNTAYQTGRTAFVINPPSIYQWLKENDEELLKNTALVAPPAGMGDKGRKAAQTGAFSWMVSKASDQQEAAKDYLRFFFENDRYRELIDVVGGRWVPVYPELTDSMPLFADNPKFENFGELVESGIPDGFRAPPSALAAQVFNARIVTNAMQKVLVDGTSVEDAVAWAQEEIEKLKNAN